MQTASIIPSTTKEELKKKRLRLSIQKKRLLLEKLVTKTEMLRVNLEIAKQEYMVKVGNLFLKDSHLDLEIIRLKNILHFMKEGLTYDQAVNNVTKTYYAEQLELEMEQKRMQEEEEIYQKREKNYTKNVGEIKKLWKKLIAKFHPDLVQDYEEKKKRDTIMKQINRAYQEGDYDQLLKIEHDSQSQKEQTINNLEEILVKLVNEIMQQNEQFRDLKNSEWYSWMIKIDRAKRKNMNIFVETERQLLNDIVVKLDLIKELKTQIENISELIPKSKQ